MLGAIGAGESKIFQGRCVQTRLLLGIADYLHLRHQALDGIGDAGAVEAGYALHVEVAQVPVVGDVEVLGDCGVGEHHHREIEFEAVHFKLGSMRRDGLRGMSVYGIRE